MRRKQRKNTQHDKQDQQQKYCLIGGDGLEKPNEDMARFSIEAALISLLPLYPHVRAKCMAHYEFLIGLSSDQVRFNPAFPYDEDPIA